MASAALTMPGPSAATKASASSSLGMARNTSVTRMKITSTQPPTVPETAPMISPIGAEVTITSATISSVRREP